MPMLQLPTLQPGDQVEIIAPASRCTDEQLTALKKLLTSWQLNCLVANDIFGKEIFTAHTDEMRFNHLKNALFNPDTKAIFCARGGYGSMRLIPALSTISPPKAMKLFIGMSDTTALQLFFQQHWHWPSIHGVAAPDRFSSESISVLKKLLFGEITEVKFSNLTPLNAAAKKPHTLQTEIIGGNLSLVQTSIGTKWQLDGKKKIIFLEETGERGYRVDRMLEHLCQAGLFDQAIAILFGDFIGGNEPDGKSLISSALARFAGKCTIPVAQVKGIGHDYVSYPLPLGTQSTLQLDCHASMLLAGIQRQKLDAS